MPSSALALSKEMKEAIDRSGYLFEQRLVPLFAKFGYYAMPNYRYSNPENAHSLSELDIYAIAAKTISRQRGRVWISLLVECKNLRCPLVFFTHKQPYRTAMFLGRPHISGLPQEVFERGRWIDLSDFLKLDRFHHYYSRAKIATQFCAVVERKKGASSPKKTSDDYVAGHQVGELNLYDDGILKLSQAALADKRDFATNFSAEEMGDKRVDLWFHYPIFVTSGALYECPIGARVSKYRRVHRIGFLLRTGEKSECKLDVVDTNGLRDILRSIDRETDRIVKLIQKRYAVLGSSRRDQANQFRFAKMKSEQRIHLIAGEIKPTGEVRS